MPRLHRGSLAQVFSRAREVLVLLLGMRKSLCSFKSMSIKESYFRSKDRSLALELGAWSLEDIFYSWFDVQCMCFCCVGCCFFILDKMPRRTLKKFYM